MEVSSATLRAPPNSSRNAKITVKSGAQVWSRDLNVQPGATVNVKATLKK